MPLRYPLLSFRDIVDGPLPEINWCLQHFFAQGDRVVMYGLPGSRKSWLLIDMCLHLAAGRRWLCFDVPKPRRVLYVDEDQPYYILQRRVQRLSQGMGVSEAEALPYFKAMTRPGFVANPKQVTQLLKDLEEQDFRPEVIVVETLTQVIEGNENSNADIKKFWQVIGPCTKDAGAAFLLAHHMNKDSPENPRTLLERARGGTNIPAGCEVVVGVSNKHGLAVLSPAKSRTLPMDTEIEARVVDVGPHDACVKDGPYTSHNCPVRVQLVTGAPEPSQPRSRLRPPGSGTPQ